MATKKKKKKKHVDKAAPAASQLAEPVGIPIFRR